MNDLQQAYEGALREMARADYNKDRAGASRAYEAAGVAHEHLYDDEVAEVHQHLGVATASQVAQVAAAHKRLSEAIVTEVNRRLGVATVAAPAEQTPAARDWAGRESVKMRY